MSIYLDSEQFEDRKFTSRYSAQRTDQHRKVVFCLLPPHKTIIFSELPVLVESNIKLIRSYSNEKVVIGCNKLLQTNSLTDLVQSIEMQFCSTRCSLSVQTISVSLQERLNDVFKHLRANNGCSALNSLEYIAKKPKMILLL